ncbi:MAG TPA: ABC transporter ATP-binding protein, partial [Candidatus Hodarchaeales archaeon]|nr:ABC transporter ATP-binding protein [Candidatus Hodarchaeales archaeon]
MGFFSTGIEAEKYDRQYSDAELVRRIWQYLRKHRASLILATLCVLLGAIANLLLPQTLTTGIDLLLEQHSSSLVVQLALTYFVLGIIAFFLEFGRIFLTARMTAKTIRDLRARSYDHLLDLDQSFYDTNRTGRIMARISNDSEELDHFFGLTSQVLSLFCLTMGTFIVLVLISPTLTLMGLIVTPGIVLLAIVFRKFAKRLTVTWRRSFSTVNATFQEGLSGITVAKGYARISKVEAQFKEVNRVNYGRGLRRAIFFSSIFPAIDFFATV